MKITSQTYKKSVERYWADRFLCLYNKKSHTRFILQTHNDNESPDFICSDFVSGEDLGLEIKSFSNVVSDLREDRLATIAGREADFEETYGHLGSVDSIIEKLKSLLTEMQDTKFENMNVALAIPSVRQVWNCDEFLTISGEKLNGIATPLAANFLPC